MESQVVHSLVQGRADERDPNAAGLHSVVEGEEDHGEHHHEKKSVLKKVKAKAKKLKDTITKHGHGHEHDHDNRHEEGHVPDDHDLEEEDYEDEDEEMVTDPEIHGAPMYEAAAMRAAVPGIGFDKTKEHGLSEGDRHQQGVGSYGRAMAMDEGPRGPANTPQSAAHLGTTTGEGLEEDPDAPKDREELYRPSNYQTKVTDPTASGGDEAKIAPLGESFGGMHIYDRTEAKPKPSQSYGTSTGSHDQFSPEPMTEETETLLGSREPVPESDSTARAEGHRKGDEKPSSPRSYSEKISSAASAATSALAGKATAAKDILTSKLRYGATPEGGDLKDKPVEQPPSQGGYAEKISSATHAIADKAVLATGMMATKIGYGRKEEQTSHKSSALAENVGDKPSEQSSYTGKIAAVAETAKEVVVSKLGYGKKGDEVQLETEHKTGEGTEASSTTVEHGEKKAAGQDRGVSVRDYLAEKLKPGEEDRALSQVISSALDKRKKGAEEKPTAVVMELEQVRSQLGEGSQMSSPGRAVVGKLRETVGSWFGKSIPGDPQSHDHQQQQPPHGMYAPG